jgi:predicted AAA+ superfamily ATPase
LSLELLPFSFEEYIGRAIEPRLKKIEETVHLKSLFLNYLDIGGFPDLKEMPKGSRLASHYLTELYDRIVSRDLVQRRKIRNIKALKELALSLLSNYSGRFTYQSLKRLTSINSINTVKNYVDFIQESYLGFVVEPFSFKIKERISLPKKFYTIDVALAEAIVKSTRFDLGKKLENIIYLELRRRGLEIYYIYHAGYEVDFAIRSGKKLTELIQVTWDLSDPSTRKREINSLIKAAKDFKVESLTIIIHEGEEEVITSDDGFKITVLIAWKWLLTSG